MTLAAYLRDTLHLTGTKIACGSSGCGSCTVILSRQAVFEISSHFISNYSLEDMVDNTQVYSNFSERSDEMNNTTLRRRDLRYHSTRKNK